MTVRLLSTAFAAVCCLSLPVAALAKGGHGGGHSSGGHGGGHASGGHGSGHASSGAHGSSHGSGGHSRAGTASGGSQASGGTSSVPATATTAARPRDREPVIGTAVSRTGGPFVAPRFFYSPLHAGRYYRIPIGFGGAGLYGDQFSPAYGPGIFGYSDYMYDYGGVYAYPGEPVSPGYQPAAPEDSGNLRLMIDPPAAQVYVDGSFVGTVEDAGSALAGLRIGRGSHRLEFRAPGYETLTVDVTIDANRTITYRSELRRLPPR